MRVIFYKPLLLKVDLPKQTITTSERIRRVVTYSVLQLGRMRSQLQLPLFRRGVCPDPPLKTEAGYNLRHSNEPIAALYSVLELLLMYDFDEHGKL